MIKNKYLIIFILFFNFQFGQYGKNIVQYDKFEWYFIQTLHFDIYYYSDEESQIDFVASYTEKAYDKISNLIGWGLNDRSSIIVYNSLRGRNSRLISISCLCRAIKGKAHPKLRLNQKTRGTYILYWLMDGIVSDTDELG